VYVFVRYTQHHHLLTKKGGDHKNFDNILMSEPKNVEFNYVDIIKLGFIKETSITCCGRIYLV